MKVFVYTKNKDSKKIMEIHDVKSVRENKKAHTITFYRGVKGEEICIDTRYYKSTIYQN